MRSEHASSATALTCAILLLFGSTGNLSSSPLEPQDLTPQIIYEDTLLMTASINKAAKAYGNWLSVADCSFLASHFDLLVTDLEGDRLVDSPPRAAEVAAMVAANPDMIILGLKDLIGMYTYASDWPVVDANEAWFIHDSGGNRITNNIWGWYLMDVGNSGWREHFVTYVNAVLTAVPGYSGVYCDDTWDYMHEPTSGFSSTVPPAVVARWHADTLGMLQYIKANINPGKSVIINTEAGWTWGYEDTDYIDAVDGMEIEGFCHAPWDAADVNSKGGDYTPGKQLDVLAYCVANGKLCFAESGCLTADSSWINYAYAMFLMASGSGAYWGWTSTKIYYSLAPQYLSLMDTDIGTASGAYYSEDSIYKRAFTKGKAYFNPSASAYSVAVGSYFTDAYTSALAASPASMVAYSGKVYISPYTVTSSASTGGTVSPTGATTIRYGDSQAYTATPSDGYFFNFWELDEAVYNTTNPLTYSGADAASAHTLKAYFTQYTPTDPQVYYVEAYAGQGGSVSPSGQTVVEYPAGSVNLVATASYGYTFKQWKLNGAVVSFNASITYSSGNPPNVYIFTAEFEADPAPTPTYTITASAGANGSITNSGVNVTAVGTAYTSLATADGGFIFSHWTRAAVQYSTANPISISLSQGESATLVAVFIADTESPPDPDEPDPTPQPAPPTASGRFNNLIATVEKQTPDGSIWDSHVWVSGLWDKCVSYRTVERQQEKAPAV